MSMGIYKSRHGKSAASIIIAAGFTLANIGYNSVFNVYIPVFNYFSPGVTIFAL